MVNRIIFVYIISIMSLFDLLLCVKMNKNGLSTIYKESYY